MGFMKINRDIQIWKYLKKNASPERQRHVKAVAEYAWKLARLHGWEADEAYRAGLVHDAAKEWSRKKLLSYVDREKIKIPFLKFIRQESPKLLHAYVGARLAMKKGWIKTKNAEKAISSHTLGTLRMSLPEKILFVADYASFDRSFVGVAKFRNLARSHIDKAYRTAFMNKMEYTFSHRKPLHPLSLRIWNSFTGRASKKESR